MRAATGVIVLLAGLAISGCLNDSESDDDPADVPKGPPPENQPGPAFTTPKLIDDLRAGGEPVIAVTHEGSLIVSSHPGYTHYHPDAEGTPPGSAELIVPTQGQSYLWRSTDGGESWTHVSLIPVEGLPNSGPRGLGQGVSDPDLTVDANGRIWLTDLEALASASISWSDDDGETWLMGNNVASEGAIDRQWLASYGDELYFTGNYLAGPDGTRPLKVTTDGLEWEARGQVPCSGDILANPVTGTLYAGCGTGVAVSTDAGNTWEVKRPEGLRAGGPISNEPAIDGAGTVYVAADMGREGLVLAWTSDDGQTWGNVSLAESFPDLENGTIIWPWVSAGSEGRVAVTFYASPTEQAYAREESEWFVYTAIVINATKPEREIYASQLTPEPFHRGGLCQSGTTCQATTAVNDNSDRRLGDFFETTIDHEGYLHIVYSDTQTKPSDSISHVGYVRMTDGPPLVVGPTPSGFPTQG